MNFTARTLLCCTILLIACKKEKVSELSAEPSVTTEIRNGFPNDLSLINGYFYASNTIFAPSTLGYRLMVFGALHDPASNIVAGFDHVSDAMTAGPGNVAIGSISINDLWINPTTTGNFSAFYYSNATIYDTARTIAHWKTEGNGSFKGFDLKIPRGFPVLKYTFSNTTYTCSLKDGYLLNIQDKASNYDSLVISLGNSFKSIKKRLIPGASSVFFNSNELSALTSAYGNLNIYAYNYSTKTIENVTYLFELSSKIQVSMQFVP